MKAETQESPVSPIPPTGSDDMSKLIRQYGCGPVQFTGTDNALYERHLVFDNYMHLADLKSYLEADQRLRQLYAHSDSWARKAILNVAGSGKFSSDRTIAEYAADIWKVKPCPVP